MVDDKGKPVEGAEVTVASKTSKSDKNGIASFTGIPAGTHDVIIKTSGGQVKAAVSVNGDTAPAAAQSITVQGKPQSKLLSYLITAVGILIVVGVAVYAFLRFWPKKPLFAPIGAPVGMAGGSAAIVPGAMSTNEHDETLERLHKFSVDTPSPDSVIHPTDSDTDSK